MSKTNEIVIYNKSQASIITGEIKEWDDSIFPYVIRKKLLNIIINNGQSFKQKVILDFGCGGGWLSAFLKNPSNIVVGVDISSNLLENAKNACAEGNFILCDCEQMPFRNSVFQYVIGVSILHHLNINRSCREIYRISKHRSGYFFEEPNILNPFSEIGKKFFPIETLTSGEKPFIPNHFLKILHQYNFKTCYFKCIYFIAFPISRLFKILNVEVHPAIVCLIFNFESIMEKIPVLKTLNSSIIVSGIILKN